MSKPRDAAEQTKLDAAIKELFEHRITFNEFLGFRIDSLQAPGVRIAFDMRTELVGHFLYGRLHGGVISSVLDVAGGLAIMCGIGDAHPDESAQQILERFTHLGTIDLRVDYLRQGIGKQFIAEAHAVRIGRRIAAASMRLLNEEGTLIATGNANYIVS